MPDDRRGYHRRVRANVIHPVTRGAWDLSGMIRIGRLSWTSDDNEAFGVLHPANIHLHIALFAITMGPLTASSYSLLCAHSRAL